MKIDSEILFDIRLHFTDMITQSMKYSRRRKAFVTWETLNSKEGGNVKIHINFFKRFCKTHSSYIVKDAPNIQVPAEMPDQIESKMVASKKEKALYLRWKANSFVRKLKVAAYRASVFGDIYFMLSHNKDNKSIDMSYIDPSNVIYDTIDSDPMSPIKYVVRAKMVDVKTLRKQYPDFKEQIIASNMADDLMKVNKFTKSDLRSDTKAVLFIYMDDTYIYKVVNANYVVERKEHKMWFVPFYHRPYIDTGDRYGDSMVDILYESVKNMHLSLSFLMTNAYDTAQAPIIAVGTPPTFDKKAWPKWLITMGMWGSMNYMQPPQWSLDLYKSLEYSKILMHFISGISEEAMAWFTGALTSAGVSIELRLDSTVREAIDSQVVLKGILEKMNSDWLKMMEKYLKNENLLKIPWIYELNKSTPFTGGMLWGNYYNIVDFWGILPRSEATLVNNVLAKYNAKLISKDTALEELRYMDPTLEMSKMVKESIDIAKLQKALESWATEAIGWFDWPKDENYYMIVEKKVPPVTPEQNHEEHWMEHKKAYDSTQDPLVMSHMMMHEEVMKWTQSWAVSKEGMQDQQQYGQQPLTEQQATNGAPEAPQQEGGMPPASPQWMGV